MRRQPAQRVQASACPAGAWFPASCKTAAARARAVAPGQAGRPKTRLALGIAALDISTAAGAATAVSAVTTAGGTVGTVVGNVGAIQNRLQYAVGLAQSQVVNKKAAESRIRDANVAEESANLTRYQILTQSGIASLAQANQSSSAVLKLLG